MAEANGCEYCLSAHSYLGKHVAKLADDELDAARDGRSADAKVQALLQFTQAVVANRGRVDDADLARFLRRRPWPGRGGRSGRQRRLNVFTNYLNNIARTTVDFPHVHPRGVRLRGLTHAGSPPSARSRITQSPSFLPKEYFHEPF